MLGIFFCIGAAPAAWLGPQFGRLARLALAPVFGLCLSTSVFTTLIWLFPARDTYWLVPVLVIGSLAIGIRRSYARQIFKGLAWRRVFLAGAQFAIVFLVVAGPMTATFVQHQSIGPVAYQVPDAGGYVLETDGMIHESMRTAASLAKGPWDDLVQAFWTGYSFSNQEVGVDPVSANVDALLGTGATSTQTPFLLAVLVVAALGALGVLIRILGKAGWTSLLGAVLFGGAFFMQLLFDGSEAAICGIAVLGPLALLAYESVRDSAPSNLALLALLCAGSIALYPLFVPAEALTALIALSWLAVRAFKRGRLSDRAIVRGGLRLGAVIVVTMLFNLVAAYRDTRYLLHVSQYVHTQPNYRLPISVVASWLTQTRGFYELAFAAHSSLSNVLVAVALPIPILALVVLAITRHRLGMVLALFALVCAVIAIYERTRVNNGGIGCTYCEERTLLPVSAVVILLFALGLAALTASRHRKVRALSVVVGLLVLGVACFTGETALSRFGGSYFLPASVGAALNDLPASSEVALEGFDEAAPNPPAELMLTYARADEKAWKRVSITADSDENNSLLYFGNLGEKKLALPNPQFHVPFHYVLTRVAAVRTDRRTTYRSGAIALQEIVNPTNALIDSGFSVEQSVRNPSARPVQNAWVNERMQFVVTGGQGTQSYVRLGFKLPSWLYTVRVISHDLVSVLRTPHRVSICLKAVGPPDAQVATVRFPAGTGEQLLSVSSANGSCPAAK